MWQYWQYWQSMARPDQVMRGSPGSGTSLYRPWAASAGSGQCPLSPHTVASTLSLSPGPGSLKYVTRGAMGLLSQSALSCSCHLMSPHPAHHGHGLSDDISEYVFLKLSYVALAGLLPFLEAESLSGCIIETSYLETKFQEKKLFCSLKS